MEKDRGEGGKEGREGPEEMARGIKVRINEGKDGNKEGWDEEAK